MALLEQKKKHLQAEVRRKKTEIFRLLGKDNSREDKKTLRRKRSVKWDEETISEHDKDRGTRQKIDEPDTPFVFEEELELGESWDGGGVKECGNLCFGVDYFCICTWSFMDGVC